MLTENSVKAGRHNVRNYISNSSSMLRKTQHKNLVDLKVDREALKLIKQATTKFRDRLLLQAKILAHKKDQDIVLRGQVKEALDYINKGGWRIRWRSWTGIVGGAFLGAALSAFVNESRGSGYQVSLRVYLAVAMGLLLAFISSRR